MEKNVWRRRVTRRREFWQRARHFEGFDGCWRRRFERRRCWFGFARPRAWRLAVRFIAPHPAKISAAIAEELIGFAQYVLPRLCIEFDAMLGDPRRRQLDDFLEQRAPFRFGALAIDRGAKNAVNAALRAGARSDERVPIGRRTQRLDLLQVANDLRGDEAFIEIRKLTQALKHLLACIAGFWPDGFDGVSQRDEQIVRETFRFQLAGHSPGYHVGAPLQPRAAHRRPVGHDGHEALGVERHEAVAHSLEYLRFVGEPTHGERHD